MGLFGIYMVNTRDGIRFMTAKALCKKVEKQSKKSNYNWSFSAEELVNNCTKPGFQEKYAKQIKICILNCFANLETRKEYISYSSPEDKSAVAYCYNSIIKSENKEEKAATERYFYSFLDGIIKYDCYAVRVPLYCGATYNQKCQEWKKQMKDKYYKDKPIEDWNYLSKILNDEFNRFIKDAEEQGVFKPEERILKIVNIDPRLESDLDR